MPGFCTLLSSDSFTLKSAITLYPNPATGTVSLAYELPTATAVVALYDLSGRLITEKALGGSSGSLTLAVGTYAAGVYLVVVKEGDQIFSQHKLVVQ